MLEELWALCGKKMSDDIELRALDPFYRIQFDDGSYFDYSGDLEAMRTEVGKWFFAAHGEKTSGATLATKS